MQNRTIKLAKGNVVRAFCEENQAQMDAVILEFRNEGAQAYIHFIKQDKRLDKWEETSNLTPVMERIGSSNEERVVSRHHRKIFDTSDEEEVPADYLQFEKVHREVTKIRNIDSITIGNYKIKTWYYSPYPKPFTNMDHLFICEKCFQYFATQSQLLNHQMKEKEMTPPGNEIYRKDNISVFELKGKVQKISCQCLCLLSKLFLDHKTLFYDVEGFLFYVVCECDEEGAHIAAYFSKEINSIDNNVLACITTLPPYQKKGYGSLCISLAYEFAKRQCRCGGPERPLSDLGKVAFHSYWRDTILELLLNRSDIKTIDEITINTGIARNDIIETLKEYNMLTKIKGEFELSVDLNLLSKITPPKPRRRIDPAYLIWLPENDD